MQPSPKVGGALPASPAESGFQPRPEFTTVQHTPSNFALVTISSQSTIRLSNFPSQFVTAFRRTLEAQSLLRAYREDTVDPVCEFSLIAKFWANPKSVETECLFLEILSILSASGYSYLSTIDYGREAEDRLCLAFSRPPGPTPSQTPIFFAISFPFPTVLRVLSPPLHLTPAILQTVRTSWPRGIVSEKKVGDKCFEFKLKGYSFFADDTFASDSLQQTMSLLRELDKHSFTLTTSICLLNGRSRTKDLWIFSGPDTVPPSNTRPNAIGGVHYPAASRNISGDQGGNGDTDMYKSSIQGHKRSATAPNTALLTTARPSLDGPGHIRTKSAFGPPPGDSPTLLRRRRQSLTPPKHSPHLGVVALPSAPDKSSAPKVLPTPKHVVSFTPPRPTGPTTSPIPNPPQYPSEQGEVIYSTPSGPDTTRSSMTSPTPLLLSKTAFRGTDFRDSAFSSNTGVSHDVPIAWTGPNVPGGWKDSTMPSPIDVRTTARLGGPAVPQEGNVKRVDGARVIETRDPNQDRKSETPLVGVVPPHKVQMALSSPKVDIKPATSANGTSPTVNPTDKAAKRLKHGWVIVNHAAAKEDSREELTDSPLRDSPPSSTPVTPMAAPPTTTSSTTTSPTTTSPMTTSPLTTSPLTTSPTTAPTTAPTSPISPTETKSRRWFSKRKSLTVAADTPKKDSQLSKKDEAKKGGNNIPTTAGPTSG